MYIDWDVPAHVTHFQCQDKYKYRDKDKGCYHTKCCNHSRLWPIFFPLPKNKGCWGSRLVAESFGVWHTAAEREVKKLRAALARHTGQEEGHYHRNTTYISSRQNSWNTQHVLYFWKVEGSRISNMTLRHHQRIISAASVHHQCIIRASSVHYQRIISASFVYH